MGCSEAETISLIDRPPPPARWARLRAPAIAIGLAVLAAACVATVDGPEPQLGSMVDDGDGLDTEEGAQPRPGAGEGDGAGAAGELPEGAVADPAALGSIEETACSFDEPVPLPVAPTCYAVSVPERWDQPDPDDRVVLQVAVFEGDGSAADPVIYLDGGPGGHTLDSLSFTFANLVEPFLGSRDFIAFDQRGVGQSEPLLSCPELDEVYLADLAGEVDPEGAPAAVLAARDACRDRLVGAGVDLAAYNSVASANDVEAIRALLGYDELNVIGISYGTRLGQTYLRQYPGSVRSLVLDSVLPTGYDLWTNFNQGAIRAFEQLFDGCAASPACTGQYPDFETRFFELLDRLDDEPARVEASDLLDGTTVELVLDGGDVLGLVFNALYDRGQFAAVPQMVDEALAGDYAIIELLASVLVTNLGFVAQGQRLSVECNEEIAFESVAEYEANLPADGRYGRLAEIDGGLTLFDLCDGWPAGTAPAVEAEPVSGDRPTLLLAGQYDPITPPAGIDAIAAGLTTAHRFVLPHEGHGIVPTPCGAELVRAFFDDPASPPAASCVAASPEPVWAAGEAEPVELVQFESRGLVAIGGLRPDGWVDAGNGVFVRQQTAVDPTTLLIQPTAGIPPQSLIDLIASQLDVPLTADGTAEIGGAEWQLFTSAAGAEQAARAGVRSGADGVVVLLVAEQDEIDALYDQLFVEVAAAAEPG